MRTYSEYLAEIFGGAKVQKISVNAGFSCPNRDGSVGTGGCIYCRNDSFTPGYCMKTPDITSQIEEGKRFFSRKYPEMKYIAYFQSYTNTHSSDIGSLRAIYKEAMECEDVAGIAVGTRPDTLPAPVMELLAELNRTMPVMLEIGAETACDSTLRLINRHHTWSDVEDAVTRAREAGLHCGLHLIAGLPGEDDNRVLDSVDAACSLPIESIKIHQLQILYGTPLHALWSEGKLDVSPYELDSYLELCAAIVERVPERIVIERFLSQSPPEMVAAPKWGLKNYQFANLLRNRMAARSKASLSSEKDQNRKTTIKYKTE